MNTAATDLVAVVPDTALLLLLVDRCEEVQWLAVLRVDSLAARLHPEVHHPWLGK